MASHLVMLPSRVAVREGLDMPLNKHIPRRLCLGKGEERG